MRAAGGGKEFTITITGLPEPPAPFEVFAKREFAVRPANRLPGDATTYLPLVLSPGISVFTIKPLGEVFGNDYGITVSDQSLRNWQKLLINRNWITKDKENVKYYLCRKGERPREMQEKEYRTAWREFYARLGAGESGDELRKEIYYKYGGMPQKTMQD